MMQGKISFIILNYKDSEDTINLVNVLKEYKIVKNIVIVDNCSPDDSFSLLRQNYGNDENIYVIQTGINKGYAFGNNYGIQYLEKMNLIGEFIAVSNPDVMVEEIVLQNLVLKSSSDKNIALIAPMMLIENANKYFTSCWKLPGYFSDFVTTLPYFNRFFKNIDRYALSYFSGEYITVDVIPGAFFLLKTELLQKLNDKLFDEDTFLYCEERILAARIKKIGLKNVIATHFCYNHYESVSINKNYTQQYQKNKILFSSRKIFYKKFHKYNILANLFLFMYYDILLCFQRIIAQK